VFGDSGRTSMRALMANSRPPVSFALRRIGILSRPIMPFVVEIEKLRSGMNSIGEVVLNFGYVWMMNSGRVCTTMKGLLFAVAVSPE